MIDSGRPCPDNALLIDSSGNIGYSTSMIVSKFSPPPPCRALWQPKNHILQKLNLKSFFKPLIAPRKMRYLIFLFSEAQRNFRNKLFDLVEVQRNSVIAEKNFWTKSKRNLIFAVTFTIGNANSKFLCFLTEKSL